MCVEKSDNQVTGDGALPSHQVGLRFLFFVMLHAPLVCMQPACFNLYEQLKTTIEKGADASKIISSLCAHGCSLDVQLLGFSGTQAIFLALNNERWKTVELLVKNGASVDVVDGLYGDTPLHVAATWGHVPTIELLLAHGANVNAQRSRDNKTPLYLAVFGQKKEAVAALLQHGASPNIVEREFNQTPLHVAVRAGESGLVRLLLNYHADIEVRDHLGKTPLLVAVESRNGESAKLLLRAGADPSVQNDFKQQAIEIAVTNGWSDIVRLLLAYGAPVEYAANVREFIARVEQETDEKVPHAEEIIALLGPGVAQLVLLAVQAIKFPAMKSVWPLVSMSGWQQLIEQLRLAVEGKITLSGQNLLDVERSLLCIQKIP